MAKAFVSIFIGLCPVVPLISPGHFDDQTMLHGSVIAVQSKKFYSGGAGEINHRRCWFGRFGGGSASVRSQIHIFKAGSVVRYFFPFFENQVKNK